MDKKFKLKCFEHTECESYTKTLYNDQIMQMIDKFCEYVESLDKDKMSEFHSMSRKINDIKISLREEPINYGAEFLLFYTQYFNIK